MNQQSNSAQIKHLQKFYRLQSRFYDLTRWLFLFGRGALLQQVAGLLTPQSVLEVGCGTGANLRAVARLFPAASLTGVDISTDMLRVAQRKLQPWRERVTLINTPFDQSFAMQEKVDMVLFSYSLSMMNPGWQFAVQAAAQHLAPNGVIAVVDFNDTPLALYRRIMHGYHVRMERHLLPVLDAHYLCTYLREQSVYLGLWRYFLFIGQPR